MPPDRRKRVPLALLALGFAAACGGENTTVQAATVTGGEPAAAPAAPAREEHAVFSLIDNRLLAHPQRGGGALLLPGWGGFAKHVGLAGAAAWKRGDVDGAPAATIRGRAAFDVPLTAAQAQDGTITIRAHARAATTLTVGPLRLPLAAGWQTVGGRLDGLAAGENRVELEAAGEVALHWVQLGGTPSDVAPRPPAAELVLRRGDALSWFVHVPPGARLVGEVRGDGCAVRVAAATHGGASVTGALPAVDLSPLAGEVARVDLAAADCDEARLAAAALVVPGAAAQVTRPRRPRHVVLWIMDTLRADRVRPFNPDARAEAPNFEALARTGTLFRNAAVQGAESQTSHASIWTSLYPVNHHVYVVSDHQNMRLPAGVPILAEELQRAGLYTSMVTANGFVIPRSGYARGMDSYVNLMRGDAAGGGRLAPRRVTGVPGPTILARAWETLAGRAADPFYLVLGTIDTHKPLLAREPWIGRYDPEPYSGKFLAAATGDNVGVERGRMITTVVPEPRDLQRIQALYDANVSYSDSQLADLFAKLAEWGIAGDTMVVITADHGEELWEHGYAGHGASVRELVTHVPLAIHYPPLFPPGIVEEGVEGVDLLPTILDALGLEIPGAAQGESLIPLAQGAGRGYPRPAYSDLDGARRAVRLGRWKLHVAPGAPPALFDVVADPDERADLAGRRPFEQRFVADAFALLLANEAAWQKRRFGVASNLTAEGAAALE